MKCTYQDFILANPNCSNFTSNADAIKVFDFLNQDNNIIKMIDFADIDKPALAGCVLELEEFYETLSNPQIDFNDGFTRTMIGRMVKSILEPFGYTVTKQKDFPRKLNTRYFTSASCYALNGPAVLQIVKRIEPIIR